MGVTQIAEAQLAELRIKVSTYQCQRDLEESFRTIIKASKEQDKLIEEAENMKGEKFDTKKTRYDLIPVKALEEVAKVLTHGADKYSDNNWRQVEDAHKRYTAAAMRHGELYREGYLRTMNHIYITLLIEYAAICFCFSSILRTL